ncbi:MAG TPA: hypothetical protein VKR41_12560, partial [Puia sp.]|nr:hypothetical protein [Puia sp.]
MSTKIFLLPAFLLLYLSLRAQHEYPILTVPGINKYAHIDTAGASVLASGRLITPAGATIRITHDPFGLAISPDGSKIVTLHNGVFTIIDNNTLAATRVPSYDGKIRSPLWHGSFLGVAFAGDSKTVWLSGGDDGSVIAYDITTFHETDSISLNGRIQPTDAAAAADTTDYQDSFTADLLYNADANELLVLDRGNFRLVRIDLSTRKITASIPTGRQPFGLALSPDHHTAFVANVG